MKAYEKRTKTDIASHPLAAQLKECNKSDAVLTLLKAQVQVVDQSVDGKLTKWLDPTVNVLFKFSETLGDVVGLVNTARVMSRSKSAI